MDGAVQSAGRDPIEGAEALALLDGMTDLYVAKGRKVEHFDLRKGRPDDDALLGLMLGRSGKLRAPAMRVGKRLLIGYNAELLATTLG